MSPAGPTAVLPYGRQVIEDDDLAAVAAALRSDFLTTGPLVAEFEQAFAEAVGAPEAVVCGNGTQALHLAVLACGIGPGDWVIVPSVTFLATANAVRYAGGEVVFADVDPDTGLLTEDSMLAAAVRASGPVKAVMPVHLGGLPVDLAMVRRIADAHGWKVIEDACHALGTTWHDAAGQSFRIGDGVHGDLCCFSFHPVKTIAMGEGGAITTRDPALAKAMRQARSHGMVRAPEPMADQSLALDRDGRPNPWYYEMPSLGFNYRAPDINCALGLSQLSKLNRFIARRAELVARYEAALMGFNGPLRLIPCPPSVTPGWHLLRVLIDFKALGQTRAGLMAKLKAQGIGSQVHYIPVHTQPYYRERYGRAVLPGSIRHYESTLSLPLFPAMSDQDVDRAVAALGCACLG